MDTIRLSPSLKRSLVIKTAKTIRVIDPQQILYIEADNNYSRIFTNNQIQNVLSKTIGDMEDTVDGQIFFRCHKSYIVNLTYVKEIFTGNELFIVLQNEIKIPLARRRLSTLRKLLTKQSGLTVPSRFTTVPSRNATVP